ncbi:MAG: PaaI family thioesterase [Bacteroidota bacterium]
MSIIDKYNEFNNFGRLLGMTFTIPKPGLVHYHLTISEQHLATPIASHGGVISAMMDGVLGIPALSLAIEQNKVVSTVEFKINFLSPALLNDTLLGIGKVEQQGNRIIISSGDIVCTNRDNVLIAKAMGTFNAYPAEKAGFVI